MSVAPNGSRFREDLLGVREQLRDRRDGVRGQHDAGLPAVQVCAKLTAAVDAAITRLFETALAALPGGEGDRLREQVVLVAHGGYGRRQMAPFSDVDLMFLYEGQSRAEAESLARRLTQDIFDTGMQLGHSLRTVDEAVSLARQDAVIGSSLIESRPLVGSQTLFDRYFLALEKMTQRRPRATCAAFVEARRAEREKYGETVYLLEPNIKRSRGGLRDLHLLRWLWFVNTGCRDLDRLRMKGVLSKFDHRRLTSSREFLLRVRNDAHFQSGKAHDLLDRGEQVRLAAKLGYHGREGMLPVEQFMREYFRHAGHVWFLAARVAELSSPRPAVETVLGAVFGRSIAPDYRLDAREITATPSGRSKLTSRLDEALRLVDLARLSDRRISQDTWYLIYRSAPRYPVDLPAASRDRFLESLDNPRQLGQLLRRLHELGVLEKVIPEFTHARCLLQFNQYHKFTVDEHCIRAVEMATRFEDREDKLGEVYRGLPNKRQLHLALLLHDLGKGHDEDHSLLGESIARASAARLGLDPAEAEQLAFLVREHLWMSHLAFRRDTGDPETVAAFADKVGTVDTLKLLYLLTCADLAAVGPGVLNAWKIEVLTELYRAARDAIQPRNRLRVEDRRNAMRNAVWKLLPDGERDDSWLKRQFSALPESLVVSRPPGKVLAMLRRFRALQPGQATAWAGAGAPADTTEIIAAISQGTGRGVFSSMAGVLSAAGLQILAAETAALPDDLLLLRYLYANPAAPLAGEPGAGDQDRVVADLCDRLVASVYTDKPPIFPRVWGAEQHAKQAALTNLPSEVRIDAAISDEWIIVEVFTVDRRGLLYELARAVHEMRLLIRFAKVATSADQVVDVFYVSERDETKPTGEARLAEIRERLSAIIEPSD
ncbi:MAG: [protein-PII] uridylyltransferase [Planctomycetota bacterium]